MNQKRNSIIEAYKAKNAIAPPVSIIMKNGRQDTTRKPITDLGKDIARRYDERINKQIDQIWGKPIYRDTSAATDKINELICKEMDRLDFGDARCISPDAAYFIFPFMDSLTDMSYWSGEQSPAMQEIRVKLERVYFEYAITKDHMRSMLADADTWIAKEFAACIRNRMRLLCNQYENVGFTYPTRISIADDCMAHTYRLRCELKEAKYGERNAEENVGRDVTPAKGKKE